MSGSCSPFLIDGAERVFNPMDCSDEAFASWLSVSSLGEVLSVHNLLVENFERMKKAKDDLVNKCIKEGVSEHSHELLERMYAMLQRLEKRVFDCRGRVSNLTKD